MELTGTAFVIPAYGAGRFIGDVVRALHRASAAAVPALGGAPPIIVVDDGSEDDTAERARAAGADVVHHARNLGKGAALKTGFAHAEALGAGAAVTLDADGQHPAEEAVRMLIHPAERRTLLLAVRDLARDGAPKPSRFSNAFSNAWVSLFARERLRDTQCGLRRYPLPETLALGLESTGYELETEVIIRAVRAGIPVVEEPVRVIYPPPEQRLSHFHSVRDPARIVFRLLHTAWATPWRPRQG